MATVYDELHAMARYDGSPTAHKQVVECLNNNGQKAKMTDAWCTETIMASLYDAGAIKAIGGYKRTSGELKKQAEREGIWHSGTDGILPGDIIVYGRSGKPNHTELAVGNNVTVSGNYNGGCSRRKWKGRSVVGYVRPKYMKMPKMDNLQVTVAAVDCMLGCYGTGKTKEKMLSVFGDENKKLIQEEIRRVQGKDNLVVRDMAIYAIAGHAGKGEYRAKRLGKYSGSVQNEINKIYSLSGKSVKRAAQDVWSGKYGNGAVRRLLLKFNGYDPSKVQAEVDAQADKE